ncbi:hypothetical protein CA267_001555 [Alteromonas pelagimontana]|uniref:site-specific DNA-methyltransferase (adenine-specific) n=1 Tax=Alteromonas pelagimontana TaxID=1858656 RepID=A0A6M4M8R0_9ALTE|nr:hypothetical protein [Alteromonas pelagimontana]QJR79572.1 hypothetical protein CA267_001555 [Alteromonas pelagimontana]
MATFFRLIFESDKQQHLKDNIKSVRNGKNNPSTFLVNPTMFEVVPSAPFSYWVSDHIRNKFTHYKKLTHENSMLTATKGLATTDDFRFIRTKWETLSEEWLPLAKGGDFSPYYADLKLKINWFNDGKELKAFLDHKIGKPNQWSRWINAIDFYKKPGLTWPNATTSDLSARVLPSNCIISHMAPTLFIENDSWEDLSPFLAIMNSRVFKFLISMSLGLADTRKHYEVGIIQKIPIPALSNDAKTKLSHLATQAYNNVRLLDLTDETSGQFILPDSLLKQNSDYCKEKILEELNHIQQEIDDYCFELFEVTESDRKVIKAQKATAMKHGKTNDEQKQRDVLSWLVGVSFGRFVESRAFSSKDVDPFSTIAPTEISSKNLVSFISENKLSELISQKVEERNLDIRLDIAKFLRNDFFALHLKKYTDSRRQAPLYWQLSSYDNNFSFWLYFHGLDNQSLVSCVNDKIEPLQEQLNLELSSLKSNRSRSVKDEKTLDTLINLSSELEDFKQQLLTINKFWAPNNADGIQLNASPFWRLFKNRPWQKKLKQTWEKLQEGEYDWAHLAFSIWPERVLNKCHADRSLAIAHDVEDDLWHEVEVIKGKKKELVWEWQPKPLSETELRTYIKEKIATDDRLKLYRSNQSNNAKGGAW